MTGHGAKKRGSKASIHPKGFKQIISSKQLDCDYHSVVSSSSVAAINMSTTRTMSSTDDVLIFPTVQRLTTSSPPSAILDGIYGLKQERKGVSRGLRRNRSCSRISVLSSLAPPAFQTTRSPYQSKMAQKNLSAALKGCTRKSDAKYSCSAWERRPVSTRKSAMSTYLTSIGLFDGHRAFAESVGARMINIARTESSDSLFLPPEVSPANKFVPIGREVDDDYSFASHDYDICKEEFGEENDWPGSATGNDQGSQFQSSSKVAPHLPPPPVCRIPTDSPEMDDTHAKDSQSTKLHQPPSTVSLDSTSPQNSADFVRSEGLQEERWPVRDRYCIPLEHEDDDDDDWFPNMKDEIMKVASLISNCGATFAGTL